MEEMTITMKPVGTEMATDMQGLALALKTYRIRQGLTQQQLGERWGMSRYTLMAVEKARQVSWVMTYRIFNRLSEELRREKVTE